MALYFARPTWRSIAMGVVIGACGELVRLWAAGHLEKSREVTQSGPYRFTRHPLYVGSSIMALGFMIGSASWVAAAIVAVYMGVTIAAAIRTEEAFLRARFGEVYEAYLRAQGPPIQRRFSFDRAWRNREYRAIGGFGLAVLVLCAKAALG